MTTINSKRIGQTLTALVLAMVEVSAFAASTWNFGTINTSPTPDYNPGGNKCTSSGGVLTDVHTGSNTSNVTIGNTQTCISSNAAPSLTATAWSTTGAGGVYAQAGLLQYGTSGFGVKNATTGNVAASLDVSSPQHSMDNNLNGIDLIKLSFGSSTILGSVGLGWSRTDTDISLFRYVGGGAGDTSDITGLTVGGILSKGWQLVGNYADLATTSATNTSANSATVAPNAVNAGGLASSWWLISAYTGATVADTSLTAGNDYMKVLAVASRDPSTNVPEPASIALLGLGLVGLLASRRRPNKAE